ncbi:MAG: ArgE/DapE family deacylase [Gammaproteobacteria bacterium]|jgi:acetylornithine deacetylase|nr:ArgE/DapE family deacylase [Gammaproteobacteria bacterium]
MDKETGRRIMDAVDRRFNEQTDFLAEISRHASIRGAEQSAQKLVDEQLRERGYSTDLWEIKVDDIASLPGFSPVLGNYDEALNVVATHHGRSKNGKSLILNGHIDVVPVGPLDMWQRPPFEPYCDDGWMYGRGVGDMKAGLVANLYALDALRDAGLQPAADVFFQSVVEEECTGNGALACLQRGYRADAALIPEPFDEKLVTSQVGIIWLQVYLRGTPVHAMQTSSGVNAIEAAIPLIAALRRLEEGWNAAEHRHARFAHVEHPLNLNIGRIEGGDWPSSVPAWCCFDVRMGIYPGQDIDAARREIESCIREAAREDPYLRDNPPEISYHGFLAEGYSFADHDRPEAHQAQAILERAHHRVTGDELQSMPITATTDARFFGLYADIPALVYGPTAESIHGFNERVKLESVRRVTQSIALFIADWCGLDKYSRD